MNTFPNNAMALAFANIGNVMPIGGISATATTADVVPSEEPTQKVRRVPKTHRVAQSFPRETSGSAHKAVVQKSGISPDAAWREVSLENFLQFDNIELSALVKAIRAKGLRPTLHLVANVGDVGSRVDFDLVALPGDRVQMSVLGGGGFFGALFPNGRFFRDEVFGFRDAPPQRHAQTRGMRAFLEIVLSLRDARSLD